jgi:two-component system chemotaxis sensor kinase CheA
MTQQYRNIGEILIDMGALDPGALSRALQLQGRRLGEILVDEKLADAALVAQALKIQAGQSHGSGASFVRLPTQMLHSLLEEFETLTEEVNTALAKSTDGDLPLLQTVRTPLDRVSMLRAQFEDLLLAPTKGLLDKATQVITDTAKNLGKAVEVEAQGADFELDVALVSELSDMLTHMARNAVVHGIEPPADRARSGKKDVAKISIALTMERGFVVLRVADDGRGIDEDKIKAKAVDLGLLKADAPLTAHEVRRVIFTPGFTTAAKADAYAGRGIGLDVVEAAITRMGGTVDFYSKPNRGAIFRVAVPYTYMRGSFLALKTETQWIAIASSQVKSLQSVAPVNHNVQDLDGIFAQGTQPSEEVKTGDQQQGRRVYVLDHNGHYWSAHDVCGPYRLFIKGVAPFIAKRYAVCGTTRLPEPVVPAIYIDLGALHSTATASA